MLDIYTCIISCIVFNDLVTDIYFYDTDTWNLYDMHYLDYMTFLDIPCYCDLVFLWSCDYTTQQLLVHDISCSLYTCQTIQARSSCTWSSVSIIPVIVITFSSWYCQSYYFCYFNALLVHYYIFIFSLLLFLSFVYSSWPVSDGPLLFFSI